MQSVLALCAVLALSACAAHYAQVPPRLDLQPYGRVALVTFSDEQANGSLSTLATQLRRGAAPEPGGHRGHGAG
jgi:hypothetical protein